MMMSKLLPVFQCPLEKAMKTDPGNPTHNIWAKAAVSQFKKKLREETSLGSIKDLENCIKNPKIPTGCVPISRNQDGRLQVKSLKRYPHFISFSVWRWPQLRTHLELTEVPECKYPFAKRALTQVCINPYHYQLDGCDPPPSPPPIKVPRPPKLEHSTANLAPIPQGTPPGPYEPLDNWEEEMDIEVESMLPWTPIPYAVPSVGAEPWAIIRYYEEGNRVGEPFQCLWNLTTVDGYTDPCSNSDCFSVGKLPNVRRSEISERTRCHIGRGLRLINKGNRIFIENLGNYPIFVNSQLSNLYDEDSAAARVQRITGDECWQIFDLDGFQRVLQSKMEGGSYKEINDCVNLCYIYVSFAKGWAGDYVRGMVSQTPCWIEVQLQGPLKWLDVVLRELGSPGSFISSRS